jgi:hypothetical protein
VKKQEFEDEVEEEEIQEGHQDYNRLSELVSVLVEASVAWEKQAMLRKKTRAL